MSASPIGKVPAWTAALPVLALVLIAGLGAQVVGAWNAGILALAALSS
ncbi:hypothetical protein [Sphingopyxis macrogoltabida]|nr:hypothetical protein [Sphingopyxis macrogoltabida]